MKLRWGIKKQDSPVGGENRGTRTAEEILSAIFGLTSDSTVQIAQNSFVRFATGQLYPIYAIVNNNGNIPRQINPKHLEHTLISYFFSFGNPKEALQAQCYPLHQSHNSLQIRK